MEYKKVYPQDFDKVYPLLQKFEGINFDEHKKRLLFNKHWDTTIDFTGVMIEDNGKVAAYLGLIFSDRMIKGQHRVFCNLTSLIIDEEYRGQKLSHKIISYLKTLGQFTLTAITPIPSLYNMYKSNGFEDLNDYRRVFWRFPLLFAEPPHKLLTDTDEIVSQLKEPEITIFNTHKKYNCLHLLFATEQGNAYLVLKERKGQRRKFITNKVVNYADLLMRKLIGVDFLSKGMGCYEIQYCNNYKLLCTNLKSFAALFFSTFKVGCFCMREDMVMQHHPEYFLSNTFYHSRQMFFAAGISAEDYDTLYSEIFVLDM